MNVRIRRTSVVRVGKMNRIIREHPPVNKIPLDKFAGNGDIFVHGKYILKGKVEAVRELGFWMLFGFLHLVPEKLTVGILAGNMGRKEDALVHDAAFSRVVAVLTVVVTVQFFSCLVRSGGDGGLSRASLDLCYGKVILRRTTHPTQIEDEKLSLQNLLKR